MPAHGLRSAREHPTAERDARRERKAAARGTRHERGADARAARRERWESLFSPWVAAAAGAAISLAFLFQRSLPLRAAMFLLFFAAARFAGKRVSLLAACLVSLGIVAANLFVPVGRVLAQIGPFRVTETALFDGIGKALVFEGLICVSKASILPGLRLPGRFGSLVAAAFVYYDRIVEYKGSVKPATLIADVDRLMLSMWEEPQKSSEAAMDAAADEAKSARRARGAMKPTTAVALAVAVVIAYLPFVVKP
jgi:hypothetical protein